MKRRAFIVRLITGGVSAAVFTATGWLMGTRTLTMHIFPAQTPPCCSAGVQVCDHTLGPYCTGAGAPCPPSGGGNWGVCRADCYKYCCSGTATWCYTFCLDEYAFCCWYTDCPTP